MNCFFSDSGIYCAVQFLGTDYAGYSYPINFAYSTNFDCPVIFPEPNIASPDFYYNNTDSPQFYTLRNCFLGCELFNQPVVIQNTVMSVQHMFADCTNFNSPVTFVPADIGHPVFYNSIVSDYAAGMFSNSAFSCDLELPGYGDDPCTFAGILSNCNYKGNVVCRGNMGYYGEIIGNRIISYSGAVIYNNYAIHTGGPSPYAGRLVAMVGNSKSDASGLGIIASANTLGATVEYPYYQNAVIQVQQTRAPSDPNDPSTGEYEWIVLNNGTLPQVDDPFTKW